MDTQEDHSPTILVVDNAATVLHIAESVLSEAGYQVLCKSNPDDALEAAKSTPCAIALVASTLGDENTHALCDSLHRQHDLDIILMTARGEQPTSRFAGFGAVVDYIHKPFVPEALHTVVHHALRRKKRSSAEHFMHEDTVPSNPDEDLEVQASAQKPSAQSAALADAVDKLTIRIAHALGIANPSSQKTIANVLKSPEGMAEIRNILLESKDGPALTGDLALVPMAEVFQLLSLQRQSGFLTVRRHAAAISIAFKEGEVRLVTAENMAPEFLLGNILIQENLIDPIEFETFLTNRKGTRRRLGTQLVKLGYLDVDRLHQALRRQSTELVYELLRWHEGRFRFSACETLPQEVLEFEFGLGIDELLMEGFRRVDEWGLIEDTLPSFTTPLERVPGGEERLGEQGLAEDEKEALALVNGKRSTQDIIAELNLGTFEGASLVYRLVSSRVITPETL